jgi:hypothetical protein
MIKVHLIIFTIHSNNKLVPFIYPFNKTSSQSKQLSYKDNATFNSNEFSLGVFFKPHQEGGVIMSYSKDKTFWIPVSKRDLSTFSKQVGDKFVNDLICHASI